MSALEKLRIAVWCFLVLLGMGWGIVTGASLFAGVGLSSTIATFGVFATLALTVTQVALHREHPLTNSASKLGRH